MDVCQSERKVSFFLIGSWFCELKYIVHWIASYPFKERRFGKDVTRLSRKAQQHLRWTKGWSQWAEN